MERLVMATSFIVLICLSTWWAVASSNTDRRVKTDFLNHATLSTATVTRAEPDQHNTVEYTYMVDGITHHGADAANGLDGPASGLRVGQQIRIYYDNRDPDKSCDCIPDEVAADAGVANVESIPLAICVAISAFVLYLGLIPGTPWYRPPRQSQV